MFLRTYRISDPEFLDEEIRKIQSIGQTIKYPLYILNQCHNTAKKRFYKVETIESQRPANQILSSRIMKTFLISPGPKEIRCSSNF